MSTAQNLSSFASVPVLLVRTMPFLMQRLLLMLVSGLLPLTCIAGGTIEFKQINRLLQQKPQLSSILLQSIDLPSSAYAEVRLGSHFKHLSAFRLGPYTFQARPKGSKGSGTITVTLCTQYQFLDSSGKVIPQGSDREFDAMQVQEQLTAIVFSETAEQMRASCT